MIKPTKLVVFVALLFPFATVYAGDYTSEVDRDGYVSILPSANLTELTAEMHEVKSLLEGERDALEKTVAGGGMKASDVLIAVIVPGGLAYAANKARLQKQAEDQLVHIDNDISQLDSDLAHFMARAATSRMMLAQVK